MSGGGFPSAIKQIIKMEISYQLQLILLNQKNNYTKRQGFFISIILIISVKMRSHDDLAGQIFLAKSKLSCSSYSRTGL